MRLCAAILCAVGACALGSGCALLAGGVAGAAGHAYLQGSDVRAYGHPVRVAAQSAVVALHRMGIRPQQTKIDDFGGVIHAETADGQNVKIRIDPEGAGSVVSVRIGMFGDEKKSAAFFQKLEEALPKPDLAPIVPPYASGGPVVIPGESTFDPHAPVPIPPPSN